MGAEERVSNPSGDDDTLAHLKKTKLGVAVRFWLNAGIKCTKTLSSSSWQDAVA